MPAVYEPGPDDDTENLKELIQAFVAHAMQTVDPSFNDDIKAGISALNATPPERLRIAIDSGFVAGLEFAFTELYPPLRDIADTTRAAIPDFDKILSSIVDDDLVKSLSVIRNSLNDAILRRVNIETREDRANLVKSFYNIPEAYYEPDFDPDTLTYSEIGFMGFNLATKRGYMLAAYSTFRDDPAIPCQCPGHISTAWSALSEREKYNRLREHIVKYPVGAKRTSDFIVEFTKWWVSHARKNLARALSKEEDVEIAPAISERESAIMAGDLLSRLRFPSKDQNGGE